MTTMKPLPRQGLAILLATATGLMLAGCTPDPKHQDIPPTKAAVVQAYGQTLDESATPQQVAYVLLRSIADDVSAAQAHKIKEQKEAFKITHSLAAYSVIERRLVEVINTSRKKKAVSLGPDRDIQIYDLIHQWAPIVSHYIRSFETDFNAASQKMSANTNPDQKIAHVLYQAARDPAAATDEARGEVTIDIELAKEAAGPVEYWRVARISYLGPTRIKPATKPAITATAPG